MRHALLCSFVVLAAIATTACSGGTNIGEEPPAFTDKNRYPVFPNKDEGADPAVPAEMGGKGFTGEGWQTNTNFDLIGDPFALKGGVFREAQPGYPATLRSIGPNVSAWNQMLDGLVYESLLGLHPTTLEYIPVLATHWQISPDKATFRFRHQNPPKQRRGRKK